MIRARCTRARGGFTLVEVLLVVVIMSMIMVSIAQILTAARNARDTIHNAQETQLAGPAVLDLLERDLRGISTFARTKAAHLRVKNRVMLGLDGDSVDFVTASDSLTLREVEDRWVRADVNEVGYRLRPNPDSADQFLEIWRRESFGIDDDPFEGGTFELLCDRVKSFDVQCFAEDGPDGEAVDEWGDDRKPENVGLPARIEITLVLELAPRLVNEQMTFLSNERRTLTYKRIVRMPESLRGEEQDLVIPLVPQIPAPTAQAGGGAAGGGQGNDLNVGNGQNGGGNGGGNPFGGGGGGGGAGGAVNSGGGKQ